MALSPDALLAAGTLVSITGITGLWKLASMLAEVRTTVRSELNHNGGGSLKDQVRDIASEQRAQRGLLEAHISDPSQHRRVS